MAPASSVRYVARSVTSAMRLPRLAFFAIAFSSALPLVAQDARGPAPTAESAAKPATPKIGIVDFTRVVDAYPRAIAERKKVDELRKQQLTILDAEVKQARALQAELGELNRGSKSYDLKAHELRMKQQHIDGLQTVYDRDWRRRIDEFYTAIYSDLERAVAMVAKDRGILMVLRAHPELEDDSIENKARVFEARMVWYAAEELDITQAVINLLQVPLPPDPKAKSTEEKPATPDKPAGEQKPTGGDESPVEAKNEAAGG